MKGSVIVLLLVFTVLISRAQDKAQILAVLDRQASDWNTGNLVAYMQGYEQSDSLMFVGKSGPTYGWNQTLANYQKNYPNKATMGILKFDIKKVQLLSHDTAFVLGAWHLQREKDAPQGYFTLIFKKLKNGWKIISDHSS
ncbi:MAG: nuclear transport factor 2 family protein [Chryseobacterium sp.]|nr:MAG: nuclear transport factor 2 family protein [Chryseobacterium sp.]